jgi:hypothetical protein
MTKFRMTIPLLLGVITPIAYAITRPVWATSWWTDLIAATISGVGVASALVLVFSALQARTSSGSHAGSASRPSAPMTAWLGSALMLASWLWLIWANSILRFAGATDSPLPAVSFLREGVVGVLIASALALHLCAALGRRNRERPNGPVVP